MSWQGSRRVTPQGGVELVDVNAADEFAAGKSIVHVSRTRNTITNTPASHGAGAGAGDNADAFTRFARLFCSPCLAVVGCFEDCRVPAKMKNKDFVVTRGIPLCLALTLGVLFTVLGSVWISDSTPSDKAHLQPVPVMLCCPRVDVDGTCQDAYDVVAGDNCRPLVNGTGVVTTVATGSQTQVSTIPASAIQADHPQDLAIACPKGVTQCEVKVSLKIGGATKLDNAWLTPENDGDAVEHVTTVSFGTTMASYGYNPSPRCGWPMTRLDDSYVQYSEFAGADVSGYDVGAGVSVELTVHAVRVADAVNAMQLSISGRPLSPMLVMLVPGAGWKRVAGILLVILGPSLLALGVVGSMWSCF